MAFLVVVAAVLNNIIIEKKFIELFLPNLPPIFSSQNKKRFHHEM